MNGSKFRMLIVGMVVGAFAFGAIAATAAPKYDDRPFSGVLEGTSESAPNFAPGPDQGEINSTSTGSINATHIGEGTYTIVSDQDYGRHMEEQHVMGNCAFVEDGAMGQGVVIVAANGDEIHGAIDDDRSVICAPDSQTGDPMTGDIYHSTLYVDVVGGTGRFADATGWLFSEGTSTLLTLDPNTGEATSEDEALVLGDIDY
jgi:hypothetical protein